MSQDAEEPSNYINAHLTVTVVDHMGGQLQPSSDTAFASSREPQHLVFGDTGLIELRVSE